MIWGLTDSLYTGYLRYWARFDARHLRSLNGRAQYPWWQLDRNDKFGLSRRREMTGRIQGPLGCEIKGDIQHVQIHAATRSACAIDSPGQRLDSFLRISGS